MFQRVQTLFLLVAIVAIALTFFMPVADISAEGKIIALYTNFGLMSVATGGFPVNVDPGFVYMVAGASLVILLFCLSQFKRRKLQMLLCKISYVIFAAHMVLNFMLPGNAMEKIKLAAKIEVSGYGMAFYMPVVAILFVLLAHWRIKKDEELVKSADRLR
jgi:Domain of unknown function (DUF4293)